MEQHPDVAGRHAWELDKLSRKHAHKQAQFKDLLPSGGPSLPAADKGPVTGTILSGLAGPLYVII